LGEGPERPALEKQAAGLPNVSFTGQLGRDEVMTRIKQAACLIMPSEWYECFPLVLVETLACGRPVVASRLGAMAELVRDGQTGLLFEPGNPRDLAAKVKRLLADSAGCARMGRAGRAEFEAKYTAGRNCRLLL
jgi:glycosyltransferase involved in cell wall biosynthesis